MQNGCSKDIIKNHIHTYLFNKIESYVEDTCYDARACKDRDVRRLSWPSAQRSTGACRLFHLIDRMNTQHRNAPRWPTQKDSIDLYCHSIIIYNRRYYIDEDTTLLLHDQIHTSYMVCHIPYNISCSSNDLHHHVPGLAAAAATRYSKRRYIKR